MKKLRIIYNAGKQNTDSRPCINFSLDNLARGQDLIALKNAPPLILTSVRHFTGDQAGEKISKFCDELTGDFDCIIAFCNLLLGLDDRSCKIASIGLAGGALEIGVQGRTDIEQLTIKGNNIPYATDLELTFQGLHSTLTLQLENCNVRVEIVSQTATESMNLFYSGDYRGVWYIKDHTIIE